MIRMNIEIISSSSENPRCRFWIVDFGFRIRKAWNGRRLDLRSAPLGKSKIENPKSKMRLPVTVLLSIQTFFVGRRANVEYIYLVPAIVLGRLIGRAKLPVRFSSDRIYR